MKCAYHPIRTRLLITTKGIEVAWSVHVSLRRAKPSFLLNVGDCSQSKLRLLMQTTGVKTTTNSPGSFLVVKGAITFMWVAKERVLLNVA